MTQSRILSRHPFGFSQTRLSAAVWWTNIDYTTWQFQFKLLIDFDSGDGFPATLMALNAGFDPTSQ
jgi:hypothetical protein